VTENYINQIQMQQNSIIINALSLKLLSNEIIIQVTEKNTEDIV
jgi:hypothetical protein